MDEAEVVTRRAILTSAPLEVERVALGRADEAMGEKALVWPAIARRERVRKCFILLCGEVTRGALFVVGIEGNVCLVFVR